MITVTKSALRISFLGGGSDIPQFFTQSKHGGVTLSTTIDKHVYSVVKRVPNKHVKLMYSDIECVSDLENIQHDRARECLRYYQDPDSVRGYEIASFADIPSAGTGLGSSSSFTCALLASLNPRIIQTPKTLARLACHIEIEKCKAPIGFQDQYASAIGGLNMIQYFADGEVNVAPIELPHGYKSALESRLMMFYTGTQRDANNILEKQTHRLGTGVEGNTFSKTEELVRLTYYGLEMLKKSNLSEFGSILDESWKIKKSLAFGISNDLIDRAYTIAKEAGAVGGKILGAGGGGYLLLYVPLHNHDSVKIALEEYGYERMNFKFTNEGTQVICNDTL